MNKMDSVKRMDEKTMQEIGKRIQNARKEMHLSSINLADYVGIGSNQMSRIETGKVPIKIEYLFLLPQILNVTSDYLLFGEEKALEFKEITDILCGLNDKELKIAKNVLKAVFA